MTDFVFSNEDDEKNFLQENKWLIHSLIFQSVTKAYEEDLESVTVFRILNPEKDFIMTSELKKEDWVISLEKTLSYYESVEEYEKCHDIKNLLKKIKDDANRSNRGKK